LVKSVKDGNEVIEPMKERIEGRYALDDIKDPKTGEIIVNKDEIITEKKANQIVKAGIEQVKIRSVLTCRTKHGVLCKVLW